MTFKELRQRFGMNQTQIAEYFDIPYFTVQNWDLGRRKCPEYLIKLMEYKLEKEKKLTVIVDREQWELVNEKIKQRKQMQEKIQDQQQPPRGYKWENGKLVIDEAEAEKVKRFFDEYEEFLSSLDKCNSEQEKDE